MFIPISISIVFCLKDSTASDQSFPPLKFSILGVLGIAARTLFHLLCVLGKSQKSQLEKWFEMALAAVILVLAAVLLKTGYLFVVGITAMLYYIFILNFKIPHVYPWLSYLAHTRVWLINAYLSQVTFGYDDVHKFADATEPGQARDRHIQENADQKFIGLPSRFCLPRTEVPSFWCPIQVQAPLARVWT